MTELERWQELEVLKFRAALIQRRIEAGITADNLLKAVGRRRKEWLEMMEDVNSDPPLSSVRRYAAAIGALVQHRVSAPTTTTGRPMDWADAVHDHCYGGDADE